MDKHVLLGQKATDNLPWIVGCFFLLQFFWKWEEEDFLR